MNEQQSVLNAIELLEAKSVLRIKVSPHTNTIEFREMCDEAIFREPE